MTCGQHCQRTVRAQPPPSGSSGPKAAQAARAHSTGSQAVPGPRTEVIGTWDFKWTPGSVLRVAFQLPLGVSVADVPKLIPVFEATEALARTWMVCHENKKANIDLDFGDQLYRVLPPRSDGSDRLNISNLAELHTGCWKEQRCTMVRRGRSAPDPADVEVEFDYELLINLDPLTLTDNANAPNAPGATNEPNTTAQGKLYLPMAELGCYADRLDYGVPSMYLGPVAAFAEDLPSAICERLVAYFTESHTHQHQMARAVVHEFGHALGMPHENQNPRCGTCPRTLSGNELDGLRELYERVLKINPDEIPNFEQTTRNEFLPWPDAQEFSDWTPHIHSTGGPAESVMTTAHAAFVALGSEIPCSVAFENFLRKTSPTPHDLLRLQHMYGSVPRKDAPQA